MCACVCSIVKQETFGTQKHNIEYRFCLVEVNNHNHQNILNYHQQQENPGESFCVIHKEKMNMKGEKSYH